MICCVDDVCDHDGRRRQTETNPIESKGGVAYEEVARELERAGGRHSFPWRRDERTSRMKLRMYNWWTVEEDEVRKGNVGT